MFNESKRVDIEGLRELLQACLEGESEAIMNFQKTFGEDIYNFPVKVKRADFDKSADFYCYCFDKGRIFRRFMTFKGNCSLRTYQYIVLRDLFKEWNRTENVDDNYMLSLNEPVNDTENATEFGDFIRSEAPTPEDSLSHRQSINAFLNALANMPEVDGVYLKLLLFAETGLSLRDIRTIAGLSNRNVGDVLSSLGRLEQALVEKCERYKDKEEDIAKISAKIFAHERKINALKATLEDENNDEVDKLRKKLSKRQLQKKKRIVRHPAQEAAVSYRDIAEVLGISVGTVHANINKAKKLFRKLYSGVGYEG